MKRKHLFLFAALAMTPAAPAFAQSDEPTEEPVDEPVEEPTPVTTEAPAVEAPVAEVEEVEEEAVDDAESIQLHGWISQGAMVSSGNNYLAKTRRGSLEFFEAGVNVTKELGTNVRAGIQIFAQDLGPIGNYAPEIDWAYVDYQYKPWLGIRAGHFKNPLYLHSEAMDADMTHTSVLMPQAVYDAHFRDVLAALTGVDAYGTIEAGGAGSIEYDAYVGTLFIDPHGGDSNYDVENILGSRIIWNTPLTGLRASGHIQYANFHEKYPLSSDEVAFVEMSGIAPPGWDGQMEVNYNDWHMVGGALEYTNDKITLTGEVTNWHADLTFSPMLATPTDFNQYRGYVQAQYQVNDRLSASVYSSAFLDETDDSDWKSDGNHQFDHAASVRFDITPNLLVKAEAHAIDGYGLTEGSLNRGEEPEHRWGMFLAKTTLTF